MNPTTRTTVLFGILGLVLVGAVGYLSFTRPNRADVLEEVTIATKGIQAELDKKADSTAMANEFLAVRAEFAVADQELADRLSGIDEGLKSANIRIKKVKDLAEKTEAGIANLEQAVAAKANTRDVNIALADKANSADMTAALNRKANVTALDALASRLSGCEDRVANLE